MTSGIVAAAAANAGPASHDLLIVGPGVLGGYMGKLWKEAFPGSTVIGLTNSTNNHERLSKLGLQPMVRADLPKDRKFPYVAFTAPPSGSADYAADVKAAVDLWDGSGSFVFSSSLSVCAVDDGGAVTDAACPLVPMGKAPGTDKLLGAEQAALGGGGNVVRLVGLYHAYRGAHTFFLKTKDVPRWGGFTVNLLHYEDAARLVLAVLRGDGTGPFRGRAFLGSDNHPVTFEDMVKACALSGDPALAGTVTWQVKEAPASKGKRVDASGTWQALGGWRPKYESFESFMKAGAKDFYNTSGLF